MSITLYYAPVTCALVPLITLTEVGVEFETVPIDFERYQHKSLDYMAINPKHKVPTLVVNERVLTENVAIQQWIHRTYPESGLLPADNWGELEAISILSWCSSGIHPYLTRINNPGIVCDSSESFPSIIGRAVEAIEECLGIADDRLTDKMYFFSGFTAADAHFFWCCRRANQFGIDVARYSKVEAHFKNMLNRGSVKKALEFEAKVLAGFRGE